MLFRNEHFLSLTGTGNLGEEGTFPAGQRVYPFTFQLPNNLPYSYESIIGNVRYHASCKVVVPWGFDIEKNRDFSVISGYDLNKVPGAKVSYL